MRLKGLSNYEKKKIYVGITRNDTSGLVYFCYQRIFFHVYYQSLVICHIEKYNTVRFILLTKDNFKLKSIYLYVFIASIVNINPKTITGYLMNFVTYSN